MNEENSELLPDIVNSLECLETDSFAKDEIEMLYMALEPSVEPKKETIDKLLFEFDIVEGSLSCAKCQHQTEIQNSILIIN